METIASLLALILSLGVLGYFKAKREKKLGQEAEQLKQIKGIISRVEKARTTSSRLTDNQRLQLLKRYGRRE